ncbi:MAG: hypothetical protein ACLGG7_06580 [Bacteriovoracia bacterium]
MKKKRPLLDQEVRFLCTLWKWKILSYQLSHVLGFHELSFWRSYKIVLRLLREGYISEHSVLGTKVRVLQLTKKGFSQIRYELGDLKELRFNPQSVTHDYWATVFQLGPFAPDLLDNTSFITEQEVQAFESGVLPDWISESRDHIPDGFTWLKGDSEDTRIALEIEVNLKSPLKYTKTAYYFDVFDSPIDMIFWLCGNLSIAKFIFDLLLKAKLHNLDRHHFFLMEDFKKLGWKAPARSGQFKDKTIQEILTARCWQDRDKMAARQWQGFASEIFFPKTKSPWKKKT